MSLPSRLTRVAVGSVALFAGVHSSRADFQLVSQDLSINRSAREAEFTLTFNQPPDFATLDAQGRPANSFQIEFNGDYTPGVTPANSDGLTAVVRGDEIHVAHSVRIRTPDGNGGPDSGGWGPVIGSVPYRLVGDTLQFAAPTADLGWSGGAYQYSAYSLDYGTLTVEHNVTAVPTPTAAAAGVGGLIAAGVIARRMRRKQAA